jgi:hypothetical protein
MLEPVFLLSLVWWQLVCCRFCLAEFDLIYVPGAPGQIDVCLGQLRIPPRPLACSSRWWRVVLPRFPD